MKEQVEPGSIVLSLIGNKSDAIEMAEVSRKDLNAKATEINATIKMEVSAKTGDNIEKLFKDIGNELIKRDSSVSTPILP